MNRGWFFFWRNGVLLSYLEGEPSRARVGVIEGFLEFRCLVGEEEEKMIYLLPISSILLTLFTSSRCQFYEFCEF